MKRKAPSNCILCETTLTSDNRTKEHIIPNAIGGRRTISGLICKHCNSTTGASWDAVLAEQLSFFSLSFDICRQRGKVRPLTLPTYGGESIRVHPDGRMMPAKPSIEEISEGSQTHLRISAPTRNHLKQVVRGLQRRYPQLADLDIDEFVAGAKDGSHYSSDPLEVSCEFGGPHAGRSMVKMAVVLAIDAGVDHGECSRALTYLTDESEPPCFGLFYVSRQSVIVNPPSQRVFHLVYLRGRMVDSTIIGYIELYSCLRVVICLSDTYAGPDFEHSYAIDPTNGEELNLTVDLDSLGSQIQEAYQNGSYDRQVLSYAVSDVMRLAQEFGFRRASDRVIQKAIDEAFANSGVEEGEQPNDEQSQQIARDIADSVAPFLAHNITRGNVLRRIRPEDGG